MYIVQCHGCFEKEASNHQPLCEACRRKAGWKPWEEMTLEEKVENLNRRLGGQEAMNARF